jgi:hypothetical protein
MKKPTATREQKKTEIEQLSQAELVEMVLGLQKIIIRIARKTSYCRGQKSNHQSDFFNFPINGSTPKTRESNSYTIFLKMC